MSKLKRATKETQIVADVRVGSGNASIDVDDRFLAHMVETLARYGGLDIELEATGDLKHHLVEDVAITLGALTEHDRAPFLPIDVARRQKRQRHNVQTQTVLFTKLLSLLQLGDRPVPALSGVRRITTNMVDAVTFDVLQHTRRSRPPLRADVHFDRLFVPAAARRFPIGRMLWPACPTTPGQRRCCTGHGEKTPAIHSDCSLS